MQLSKKQIIFSEFFAPFLESISIFYHFKKGITLIAYIFPKIQTAKDVVKQMSKKLRFRTAFNSQHVKVSQIPLKSAWQHFYQISSSLWANLASKTSLLVICEILGHFVNLLSADDKYFRRNSENIPQTIQMQLPKKQIIFFLIFVSISKIYINLLTFWKRR